MADNLNFAQGLTASFANSGAVAGTGFSFTSTVATSAVINGKFTAALAPQTNAVVPTVDAGTGQAFVAVPPNNCCSLVFGVNAAGVLQLCQGRFIGSNVGAGAVPGALLLDPQFPGLPNDFCPLAYTVIRTAPTAAAWLPGASSWTATGVAVTAFQNVAQLPNRPQAA